MDGVPSARKERNEHLNMRGDQGWELVAVIRSEWFYFKKPKDEEKDG